jgi:hypothetical protein
MGTDGPKNSTYRKTKVRFRVPETHVPRAAIEPKGKEVAEKQPARRTRKVPFTSKQTQTRMNERSEALISRVREEAI